MALIDLYKKLYPIGTRVAYTREFEEKIETNLEDL